MHDSSKSFPLPAANTCRRKRIAKSESVAVDLCSCGMMQLHIGALTLRLSPDSLAELRDTVTEATRVASPSYMPFGSMERGEV